MIDGKVTTIRRPWWGQVRVHQVRAGRSCHYLMVCPCGWRADGATTTAADRHARGCEFAHPAQLTFDGWEMAA